MFSLYTKNIAIKFRPLFKQYLLQRLCTKVQEITKDVSPYTNIQVRCKYRVTIKPYDLLDCPDANRLRATLVSKQSDNRSKIDVKVSGENVGIFSDEAKDDKDLKDTTCILEVPIKSNLDVKSKSDVEIYEMHSDRVEVDAKRDLRIQNLRSSSISLKSSKGSIYCSGLLLAHKIDLFAKNGNIILDKVQGDLMHCKTEKGEISTQSCYVESSKFVVEKGTLNLKNLHKKCEIYVLKEGKINMSGFHGNAYVKANGADMNLHFSEIVDDNIILANDSENTSINISDIIEKSCFIEIHSDKVILDETASHLSKYLENDKSFRCGSEQTNNKLLICVAGTLKLGKMSWADMLKLAMGNKETR